MRKTTLYRAASWIAESYVAGVETRIQNINELEEKDDNDLAELACYKVILEYLENMEFLKAVKV